MPAMEQRKYTKEVYDALYRLEEECFGKETVDRMIDWIVNLYDREIGGFYYKTSGKETKGFLPDVESTGKCLGTLKNLGVLDTSRLREIFPADMIERLKIFARQHQSPEDGFWYELPWGKHIGDSKRLYESSSAAQLLKMIGEKPLYPLSSERVLEKAKPAQESCPMDAKEILAAKKFCSKEDFKSWFDGYLDWNGSMYLAGSLLLSHMGLIISAGYFDYALELITERLHPETGFLEGTPDTPEINYNRMSGTYKASGYFYESKHCRGKQIEMPHFAQVMDSTMQVILSEEPNCHACHIVNPWVLLRNAIDSQFNPDPNVMEKYYAMLPRLLDRTREKILDLRTPDGLYSYFPGRGMSTNQGMYTAMPLCEGEISSIPMFIISMREKLYDLLGLEKPALRSSYTQDDVVKKLQAVPKTVKIQPAASCQYDFSEMPRGPLPQKQGFRYTGGEIGVAPDPADPSKNVLRIHTPGNTRPVLLIDVGTEKGKGFTCEYEIRFDCDLPVTDLIRSKFGTWEFSTVVSFRKNEAGYYMVGKTHEDIPVIDGVDWTKYHTVKLVYTPDGTNIYFVDGKEMARSSYYVGYHPTKDAPKDVFCAMFRVEHDNPMTAYISRFAFAENE